MTNHSPLGDLLHGVPCLVVLHSLEDFRYQILYRPFLAPPKSFRERERACYARQYFVSSRVCVSVFMLAFCKSFVLYRLKRALFVLVCLHAYPRVYLTAYAQNALLLVPAHFGLSRGARRHAFATIRHRIKLSRCALCGNAAGETEQPTPCYIVLCFTCSCDSGVGP